MKTPHVILDLDGTLVHDLHVKELTDKAIDELAGTYLRQGLLLYLEQQLYLIRPGALELLRWLFHHEYTISFYSSGTLRRNVLLVEQLFLRVFRNHDFDQAMRKIRIYSREHCSGHIKDIFAAGIVTREHLEQVVIIDDNPSVYHVSNRPWILAVNNLRALINYLKKPIAQQRAYVSYTMNALLYVAGVLSMAKNKSHQGSLQYWVDQIQAPGSNLNTADVLKDGLSALSTLSAGIASVSDDNFWHGNSRFYVGELAKQFVTKPIISLVTQSLHVIAASIEYALRNEHCQVLINKREITIESRDGTMHYSLTQAMQSIRQRCDLLQGDRKIFKLTFSQAGWRAVLSSDNERLLWIYRTHPRVRIKSYLQQVRAFTLQFNLVRHGFFAGKLPRNVRDIKASLCRIDLDKRYDSWEDALREILQHARCARLGNVVKLTQQMLGRVETQKRQDKTLFRLTGERTETCRLGQAPEAKAHSISNRGSSSIANKVG